MVSYENIHTWNIIKTGQVVVINEKWIWTIARRGIWEDLDKDKEWENEVIISQSQKYIFFFTKRMNKDQFSYL